MSEIIICRNCRENHQVIRKSYILMLAITSLWTKINKMDKRKKYGNRMFGIYDNSE